MTDVRIHELPEATSWNGFFPQDKPGGSTECVSVATVEARLVTDGFVKTAVLVAGYQPLENQRLRTTDNVNFNKLQIAGVDRITTAGGFVGTSLQISGATANKLARFDASKNLVSYDLVAADIPTLNQNTTGSAAKWTTPRMLTIGATGKTVDGSANVSWSLGEIGALPLAGGTMNTGAQIKVVADITTSTSTNTVFNSAPLLVSRASSSGSAVAAIGFFNPGLNGAALYYSTSSDFRYNRNTGGIVTLWDNSNLTPAAIGAATTTHAATHHAGGSDQITGQSLSGLRTTDSPAFAGLKLGSAGGTSPSTNTPLVVRNASSNSVIRIESGTTDIAVSQWANVSASWSLGVRSDGLSGSPVGALVVADATSARAWWTSAGMAVPGQLAAGTAILKTYSDPNYFSLWGDGASAPNYTLAGSRNGAEVYLNGSTKTVLNVGAHERVIATATAVTFPLLAGSTTRIATISPTGEIGADKRARLWEDNGASLVVPAGGYGSILAASLGARTIAANTWQAGMALELEIQGIIQGTVETALEFFLGPSSTWTTPYYIPVSNIIPASQNFRTKVRLVCISTGTSGSFKYSVETIWGAGSITTVYMTNTTTGYLDTVNTTVDRVIDFAAQTGATIVGIYSSCTLRYP